jgi:plasmid stability protein
MQNACRKSTVKARWKPMPSLRIRDLPEPLHRLLQHRAQAHKRSLNQQALADLEAIAGGDPRERRRQVLDRIARRGPLAPALSGDLAPEELIRGWLRA